MGSDVLEGTTLSVYVFIVRAGGPVGVRDVTRGAGLSSTSVAYHHLLKLENLELIEKDEYSRYTLKGKATVDGYVWLGGSLVPRLMFYSFFFIGIFIAEISVVLLSLVVENLVVEANFLFLTVLTFVAMLLFVKEGLWLHRKLKPKHINEK